MKDPRNLIFRFWPLLAPGFYTRNKAWLSQTAGGVSLLLCVSALRIMTEGLNPAVSPAMASGMIILAIVSFVIADMKIMLTNTFTSRLMKIVSVFIAAFLIAF